VGSDRWSNTVIKLLRSCLTVLNLVDKLSMERLSRGLVSI
jgi:hypothetical protein